MASIRQLTPSMINKIAAGEVIERPASVVKELVENSLDAGADRIDVTVEKAGRDRLMVVDNGRGIAKEDILLALLPHATSKISEIDDLFSISSFGFRGEALASIAEISQLTLQSRPPGDVEGTRIEASGQDRSDPAPCGMAPGTLIDVRNLFFNTPVRRRYLKTDMTEFGHISEAFVRLALPNIDVHFLLRHNGRVIYDLSPTSSDSAAKSPFLARIEQIYGKEVTSRLLPIDFSNKYLTIRGFVGHPDLSRTTGVMQYFFLNRRWIRDRALYHALQEAYRGLLTVGRCPVAFLMVDINPDQVDVNVHPAKLEVRFLDPQNVYSGFLSAVRERFLRTDLRSRPAQSADEPTDKSAAAEGGTSNPAPRFFEQANHVISPSPRAVSKTTAPRRINRGIGGEKSFDDMRHRVIDWVRGGGASSAGTATNATNTANTTGTTGTVNTADAAGNEKQLPEAQQEAPAAPVPEEFVQDFNQDFNQDFSQEFTKELQKENPPKCLADAGVIQIHQKYLVFQTETGLALVDQHALHERILYEKLKRKLTTGPLDAQRLLVPEVVELSAVDTALALSSTELFQKFGVLIESFGGGTISISSYPAILKKLTPQEVFLTLLDVIRQKGQNTEREDLLEEMMHQSACKAAIKGGDFIDSDQIAELLRLAREEARTDHCPHGRPTTVLFSLQELDRLFKRT